MLRQWGRFYLTVVDFGIPSRCYSNPSPDEAKRNRDQSRAVLALRLADPQSLAAGLSRRAEAQSRHGAHHESSQARTA